MMKIGDKIPEFQLQDQDGKSHKSSEFRGQKHLLFFYPRANTAGCISQACSMNNDISKFDKAGYRVIGISNDSIEKQKKYHQKYQFSFPLLCDTDHAVTDQFGIWQLKKFMGKEFMGLVRTSFVFDENGICCQIIDKVKTKTHSEQFIL